jgi:hypothetical protein
LGATEANVIEPSDGETVARPDDPSNCFHHFLPTSTTFLNFLIGPFTQQLAQHYFSLPTQAVEAVACI